MKNTKGEKISKSKKKAIADGRKEIQNGDYISLKQLNIRTVSLRGCFVTSSCQLATRSSLQ